MNIEQLLLLSRSQNSLVKTTEIEHIQIHQHQSLKWLYHYHPSNSAIISIINLDQPSIPVADYQHAMLSSVFLNKPLKLCNLGMATGAFERYLQHEKAQLKIDSVEVNAALISIAQTEFQLPNALNIANQTAESFLAQNETQYDVILCDIFEGEQTPESLTTQRFYEDLHKSINTAGIIAINLLPNDEQDMLDILIPLRQVFAHQWLIDIPNCKNIVLIISQRPLNQDVITSTFQTAQLHHLNTAHLIELAIQLPQAQ